MPDWGGIEGPSPVILAILSDERRQASAVFYRLTDVRSKGTDPWQLDCFPFPYTRSSSLCNTCPHGTFSVLNASGPRTNTDV